MTVALIYAENGTQMLMAIIAVIIVSFVVGLLTLPWEIIISLVSIILIVAWIGRYTKKLLRN